MTENQLGASKKKSVAIVGAGFAGLTAAWYLAQKNVNVEIFESRGQAGGMIRPSTSEMHVESAANAILADANVGKLFTDLNIKLLQPGYKSKSRWIYRGSLQKFPLSITETLGGLGNIIFQCLKQDVKIRHNETLRTWAHRCLNSEFERYLISPGAQGIFAAGAELLSAELVFSPLFDKRFKVGKHLYKGSVAPEGGMFELIRALEVNLQKKGVLIHLHSQALPEELQARFSAVVVATSVGDSAEILRRIAPQTAATLRVIPLRTLTSVTVGFEKERNVKGFGCLFPETEKFNSLGVLFNSDIFAGRGPLESETWILPKVAGADDDYLRAIMLDRKKAFNADDRPVFFKVNKWERALPLYGVELQNFLRSDLLFKKNKDDLFDALLNGARLRECMTPVYLSGNYLGAIGLGRMLAYNVRLSERIAREVAT